MANPVRKQKLLRFLLSNSTLKDGKPQFALKLHLLPSQNAPRYEERFAWGHIVEVVSTAIANLPPCSTVPDYKRS